jgi:hypothetical protein
MTQKAVVRFTVRFFTFCQKCPFSTVLKAEVNPYLYREQYTKHVNDFEISR